jgi:hypothetical protein
MIIKSVLDNYYEARDFGQKVWRYIKIFTEKDRWEAQLFDGGITDFIKWRCPSWD